MYEGGCMRVGVLVVLGECMRVSVFEGGCMRVGV